MTNVLLFLILVELIGGKTLRHKLYKHRKWLLPVLVVLIGVGIYVTFFA